MFVLELNEVEAASGSVRLEHLFYKKAFWLFYNQSGSLEAKKITWLVKMAVLKVQ